MRLRSQIKFIFIIFSLLLLANNTEAQKVEIGEIINKVFCEDEITTNYEEIYIVVNYRDTIIDYSGINSCVKINVCKDDKEFTRKLKRKKEVKVIYIYKTYHNVENSDTLIYSLDYCLANKKYYNKKRKAFGHLDSYIVFLKKNSLKNSYEVINVRYPPDVEKMFKSIEDFRDKYPILTPSTAKPKR